MTTGIQYLASHPDPSDRNHQLTKNIPSLAWAASFILTSPAHQTRDAAKQTPGPELGFTYSMTKYHEIRNERDFGMESVWSCIGGYIGLFIGCSLLSLLDDGYDLLLFWFKAKDYRNKLAKHCQK